MRGPSIAQIVLVIAALATVPLLPASNVVLNFLVVALLIALVGQGWNVLGGYGGQDSFRHAAFLGSGADFSALPPNRYRFKCLPAFRPGLARRGPHRARGRVIALPSRLVGSAF